MSCCSGSGLYGLLGSGIRGSFSPFIHCSVFRRYSIDAVYVVWDISPSLLGAYTVGLRNLAKGFNVTIPFKEVIVGYLDSLHGEAREIGVVNTVVNRGGELIGYNTDFLGVIECCRRFVGSGDRVLVFGAGGAARAAIYGFYRLGVSDFVVLNRSRERAKSLREWAGKIGIDVRLGDWSDVGRFVGWASVIVNATPVGSVSCCPSSSPFNVDLLHRELVVFDMVYNPLETVLLREARKRGCSIVDGLCMLIWQALYSDKVWFNVDVSKELYDRVRREVLRSVSGLAV